MDKIKSVSESERRAVEAAILKKLGEMAPLSSGAAGNSPYSPEGAVFGPTEAVERGCRIAVAAVCKSHDGAGHYKGRGRWRTVFVVAPSSTGDKATCNKGDKDAEEVGDSGFFVRPWATQEDEEKSRGLGAAADALAEAIEKVGL